jgi:hypothetical protein
MSGSVGGDFQLPVRDLKQLFKETEVRLREERDDAIAKVDIAITEAVARLNWQSQGSFRYVCNRRGPHGGLHLLHSHAVALIRIAGTEKLLYLGENGQIYRYDWSNLFWGYFHLAEINKRRKPAHILRIAKLLDAMQ